MKVELEIYLLYINNDSIIIYIYYIYYIIKTVVEFLENQPMIHTLLFFSYFEIGTIDPNVWIYLGSF